VMERASWHIFQVLTKRPMRMYEWCSRYRPDPLPNVALGTSTENQRCLTQRLSWLLDTPARWRFLSCEPLLGPIDLTEQRAILCRGCWGKGSYLQRDRSGGAVHNLAKGVDNARKYAVKCHYCSGRGYTDELHWVIVGGESGSGYRPMDLQWARRLRDDCRRLAIPFFYKQDAARRPTKNATLDGELYHEYPKEWGPYLGLMQPLPMPLQEEPPSLERVAAAVERVLA
jgi:protein gp37